MTARSKPRGVRRLVEGWGAGVAILLIAGSAIVLALPRAVAPEQLPAPVVDTEQLARTMAADDALAASAVAEQLDVDVRAVGRELRAYNLAAATGEERDLVEARIALVEAAHKAARHGAEPLLSLRAYQMVRFVSEVRRWQESGEVSDELRELGGDFVRTTRRNLWCRQGQLLLGERALRVFFKERWNDLVGVSGEAFALTVDEDRVRYGFLLVHPFRTKVSRSVAEGAMAEVLDQEQRLRLIDRLKERDPSYPADLARGVVQYQLGRYVVAGVAFRRHLEAHPDGPYTLRAQNYLKAALDQL